MIEHRDAGVRTFFPRHEEPPDVGSRAQDGEEGGRRPHHADSLRFTVTRQSGAEGHECTDFREALGFQPGVVVGGGRHVGQVPPRQVLLPHDHDAVGILVWKRLKNDAAYDAEDCRDRPYGQRQGPHDDRGETGLARRSPEREANVLYE